MLKVRTKSTGISGTKNIGALAPIQFTATDIGKKIIVVEDGKPVTTGNKKYKFVVVELGKKEFVVKVKDNTGFAAEGRLVFYVKKDYADAFCRVIKEFEQPKGYNPTKRAAILAGLVNTMINEYDIMDKETRPLVFTRFSDVNSAQTYVEEKTRKELNPQAKAKSDDSESLKSDSGVSSQSEVFEDGNGKPKTENLYPGAVLEALNSSKEQAPAQPLNKTENNAEKAAEISAVHNLKKWLGKNNHIINDMGLLHQSLSKLRTMIQDEMNSDSSVEVKEKVSFIVGDIKHGFKADIEKFGFHEKYKSTIKDIIDTRLKKDDDEGKFKGITQLVNAITQEVPNLIEEYKQANTEFKSKHEEYDRYLSKLTSLYNTLVAVPELSEAKVDLDQTLDRWKQSLQAYNPIVAGVIQSQAELSDKINKYKNILDYEITRLEDINQMLLEVQMQEKELFDEKTDKTVAEISAKILKLEKEGDATANNKAEKLSAINEKFLAIKAKIASSGDIAEIKQDISDARDTIEANKEYISVYRSKFGSRYFYTMFGGNLENRVESLHLIKKVDQELDDYARKLEAPSTAQFSA